MSSLLSPILQRLAGHFPIPVMARAVLERCLNPQQLDTWFETVAGGQYTRTLLFSTLFQWIRTGSVRQGGVNSESELQLGGGCYAAGNDVAKPPVSVTVSTMVCWGR